MKRGVSRTTVCSLASERRSFGWKLWGVGMVTWASRLGTLGSASECEGKLGEAGKLPSFPAIARLLD